MKKLVSYLILSLILISCVKKDEGVKIIRPVKGNYPLVGRLNFIKEGQAALVDTLLNGVKEILDEDTNYIPRMFEYMLYLNPKGRVDDLVVLESTSMKVDNYVAKEIKAWQLGAMLEKKPIATRRRLGFTYFKLNGTSDMFLHHSDAVVQKRIVGVGNLENTYFVAVEQMPSPIGGIAAIQKRIVYPEIAKRAGIEGRVFIKAFIDEKGNVDKAEVIKGIGAGCDEVAIKAVKETKFIPGRQRGKPVKVQVSIPILFKLDGTKNSSNIHFLLKRTNKIEGETAKITGRVFNSKNIQPIPGVSIMLLGTQIGAATNEKGDYLITNIQPGQYSLIFLGYLYDKSESKKFTFKAGHEYSIDIAVNK